MSFSVFNSNMRFELGYSTNYMLSYVRMPNTYTDRPALAAWEGWRDSHIDVEITRWVNFVDFWMQGTYMQETTVGSLNYLSSIIWQSLLLIANQSKGGVASGSNETVSNCLVNDIDCKPKAVIDFDNFYQIHPTTEFYRLNALLSTSANVELIAAEARITRAFLIQSSQRENFIRPIVLFIVTPRQYRFTADQLELMRNKTCMRNKLHSVGRRSTRCTFASYWRDALSYWYSYTQGC